MTNEVQSGKTLGVRPGFSQPKRGFVPKGHDAVLKHLQESATPVEVYLTTTEVPVLGKIVARDRFTITLMLDSGLRRTYYKHAIESFGEA